LNLRIRFRLRTIILAIAGLSLAFAYVETYYQISRRGMGEASAYGLDGFLYVPAEEAAASHDLTRHYLLATFYAPLNWTDYYVSGAPGPVQCIMWRLSESSRNRPAQPALHLESER
jgi:hypothetical protein